MIKIENWEQYAGQLGNLHKLREAWSHLNAVSLSIQNLDHLWEDTNQNLIKMITNLEEVIDEFKRSGKCIRPTPYLKTLIQEISEEV